MPVAVDRIAGQPRRVDDRKFRRTMVKAAFDTCYRTYTPLSYRFMDVVSTTSSTDGHCQLPNGVNPELLFGLSFGNHPKPFDPSVKLGTVDFPLLPFSSSAGNMSTSNHGITAAIDIAHQMEGSFISLLEYARLMGLVVNRPEVISHQVKDHKEVWNAFQGAAYTAPPNHSILCHPYGARLISQFSGNSGRNGRVEVRGQKGKRTIKYFTSPMMSNVLGGRELCTFFFLPNALGELHIGERRLFEHPDGEMVFQRMIGMIVTRAEEITILDLIEEE